MPGYTDYGAGTSTADNWNKVDNYDKTYQAMLDQYAKLAAQRGREKQSMMDNVASQQRQNNLDWASTGAQGAGMGASFGPWGALIGGIAGSGLGMAKAYNQRRNEGAGVFDAATRTLFDLKPLTSGNFFANAAAAAPNVAGAFGRAKAAKSTIGLGGGTTPGQLNLPNQQQALGTYQLALDPSLQGMGGSSMQTPTGEAAAGSLPPWLRLQLSQR